MMRPVFPPVLETPHGEKLEIVSAPTLAAGHRVSVALSAAELEREPAIAATVAQVREEARAKRRYGDVFSVCCRRASSI